MNIIYLHQYFNTPEMSGGTRSYEIARRMVSAGHVVHMVTSYRDENCEKSEWFTSNEEGITVHWFPVLYSNHMSYFERVSAFFVFAWAARKKAMSLGGDVVFATSTPLTIALPAIPASKKNKIPMVFEVRDLWPEMPIAMGVLQNPIIRYLARKLESWAYKNSSSIIALSPGMKRGVVATGYPSSRVAVIPNSSDNLEFRHNAKLGRDFRKERTWLNDKPLLVYTGTFGKVNGVDYLVELARELKALKSDIKILLVGDGQERQSVINKAKRYNVYNDNLFFEQSVPKKQIPALLSAADMSSAVFIDLPEMRPNSANKFFDALASGTPVLLNYGGWMHDLVNKHDCGLAMWKKSIVEVATELEYYMHDKLWLNASGESARLLAEQCFDRDILAGQLIEVIEAVVEGHPDRAEAIASGIYD
jgi:glycosyltransferase involved in cell wall biosynthesis